MQIALIISLALAAGILSQSLARHARIPGIVLLIATGVLLGPDVLGIIQPQVLGQSLYIIIEFAVAIILFEGGMNLDLKRLRSEAKSIQNLISVGAIITMIGAAIAARFILHWTWEISFLFGSLVIVTGPTVITPLLRKIRAQHKVSTILEAEGIFIDAVGVLIAVITLEIIVSASESAWAMGVWHFISRLGFGFIVGLIGGICITYALKKDDLIPEGLENVFALSMALVVFHASNWWLPESGIMAVIVAGLVVGNAPLKVLKELKDFKEQLTVLFIGMLFVLLASNISIKEVFSLGVPGIICVLVLMFIVRPLNVLVSTYHSGLKFREKVFLSWIAPRGIVAAAFATLAERTLTEHHMVMGSELRGLVFLVIGITVTFSGLTGPLMTLVLRLKRPTNNGYVILGAHVLSRLIGRFLKEAGHEVLFVESNAHECHKAEEEGFKVLFGNGIDTNLLVRADVEGRRGCIGLTTNDEINYLFVTRSKRLGAPAHWMSLHSEHDSVDASMVEQAASHVLFGIERNLDLWNLRLHRKQTALKEYSCEDPLLFQEAYQSMDRQTRATLFPFGLRKKGKFALLDDKSELEQGDTVLCLVFKEAESVFNLWLAEHNWKEVVKISVEQVEDVAGK